MAKCVLCEIGAEAEKIIHMVTIAIEHDPYLEVVIDCKSVIGTLRKLLICVV